MLSLEIDGAKVWLKVTSGWLQRSPSGFNLQPYHVVIVDDQSSKQRLADAMLGGNGDRVLAAPLTAVFVADAEPLDHGRLDRVLAAERNAGKPSTYLRNMPFDASVFIGRRSSSDPVGSLARQSLLGLGSLLVPLPPAGVSPEGWAFKQTGIAAMAYMLAATAAGLGTYPMEGVDQLRVRQALGLPSHMSVPIAIATGYAKPAQAGTEGQAAQTPAEQQADGAASHTTATKAPVRSPRLPADYLFRHNTFSKPFKGVVPLQ